MNRLRTARRIDYDAARALLRGDPAEALAEPLVESVVEALKTVGRVRSRGSPRQPDLDRQIEDQSEIRGKSAEGETVQSGEIVECQVPAVTLVGCCRIGKPVGDHPH